MTVVVAFVADSHLHFWRAAGNGAAGWSDHDLLEQLRVWLLNGHHACDWLLPDHWCPCLLTGLVGALCCFLGQHSHLVLVSLAEADERDLFKTGMPMMAMFQTVANILQRQQQ